MKPIRRVLIAQPYGIGDLLFVTPVLRALRLLPAVEKVDLLLGSRTSAVVRSNPHVDEIFSIDKDLFGRRRQRENFRELAALGARLRSERYDLLLDYSLRGEYAFFSRFFLGIRRRAGFDYKRRGFFHTHRLGLPEGFKGRHAADYFCDLAELAGVPVEDRFLEFYVTDKDREEAQQMLNEGWREKRFIVVSPGGGESWGKDAHFKRWPVRFFAEMMTWLRKKIAFEAAAILASETEQPLADELVSILKEQGCSEDLLNLAGRVSIGASAAILEKAALLVANDGGLVHLARALRTPLIAFYGPVDPEVYGPYPGTAGAAAIFKEGLECRPCYQKFRYRADCPHRNCLQDLQPEEVFQKLESRSFLKALSPCESPAI